jgi:hypothetical protein
MAEFGFSATTARHENHDAQPPPIPPQPAKLCYLYYRRAGLVLVLMTLTSQPAAGANQ